MFSPGKAVDKVRKQLVDSYGVPELNEGLVAIQEFLPILEKKITALGRDMNPADLNKSILQMAYDFKSKDANFLTSSEMSQFVKTLCQ